MRKTLLLGTCLSVAISGLSTAVAQDDEIIVTATKREQTLQEVPIAVSVVDGDVIEKAEIRDVFDLQSVVPALRVSQLERSANSTFIIRGFGNGGNNIGIEPSVAVFIDGVFRTRSSGTLGDFPDVERVEVLRGPQSTLFGKNASAGVISFVTKKPSFTQTASLEGTYGNYNQTAGKAYISGPLSDNVAYSLAGAMNKRDGYVDNVVTGGELNERDRWMVRGQLLVEPSDNSSVRLIADYDTLEEQCCFTPNILNGPTGPVINLLGGQVPDDPFSYETALNFEPTNEVTNYGFSGQVDVDLGWADFVSITSYRGQQAASNGDVDFTSAPLIGENLNEWDINTFTQEFRFSGSSDRVDWLAGAFLYKEDLDKDSNVLFGPGFRPYSSALSTALAGADFITPIEAELGAGQFFETGTGTREKFAQENTSYNIFGQLDFAVTDRLTATVGVGYVNDEKKVAASAINDDLYASLDLFTFLNDPAVLRNLPLEDSPLIGATFDNAVFGTLFGTIVGQEPTPANIGAWQALLLGGDATAGAQFAAITANTPATEVGVAAATATGLTDALGAFQFLPAFLSFPNAIEDGETNDDKVTYTARLAFDATDAINVYGSYSTGYKASSWNLTRDSSYFASDQAALAGAGLIPQNRGVGTRFAGPEEVEVWELGIKAKFPRGTVNVAVFDQTIEGFQSTIFQGTGFVLANAGEQTATGIEIDAVYNPIDALTLNFSGLFLDPEYEDFQNAPGIGGPQDLSGTQPAGIHTTSLFFGAQYDHDFANGMSGYIRGDYQYEDDIQVVDNIPTDVASREVNLFNASAGLAWENGLQVSVWGRNLGDDEYLQSAFPTTAQNGSVNGYPNQPQTYGITVKKEW